MYSSHLNIPRRRKDSIRQAKGGREKSKRADLRLRAANWWLLEEQGREKKNGKPTADASTNNIG